MLRRIAYGLFLALAAVVLLAAAEGGLRLAGVGVSTQFLLVKKTGGMQAAVSNKAFYQQFYSMPVESLVNWDDLEFQTIPEKPAGTFRVFVFGESAANGMPPDTAYSFWRVLRAMLQERFPAVRFEFCNAACPGANSHVMRTAARACARMHPDLFLVYMGNNEFVGPFGAGSSVTAGSLPSLGLIRARIALSDLRLTQVLHPQAYWERVATVVSEADVWRYLTPINPDGDNARFVAANFGRNLEDIVRFAGEGGADAIFSTVAVNLKDWAPIESRHAAGLTDADRAAWQKRMDAGAELDNAGNAAAAEAEFETACRIDPAHAEGLFLDGQCLMRLGRTEDARERFSQARDRDWVIGRTTTRLTDILRGVTRRSGATLVEGERALSGASPGGVVGREMMYDNVHMTYDGNCALAAAFFPAVAKRVRERMGVTIPDDTPPARPAIDRRLAMTPYRLLGQVQTIAGMLPAFRTRMPLTWNDNIVWLREKCEALLRESGPEGFDQWLDALETAWQADPEDYYLGQRRVGGLTAAGRLKEARTEAEALQKYWPLRRAPRRMLAEAMADAGEPAAAAAQLRALVDLFPDDSEGWAALGRLSLAANGAKDAMTLFGRAVAANPANLDAQAGLAMALARTERLEEALNAYLETVRMNPRDAANYEAADTLLLRPTLTAKRAAFWKGLADQYPTLPLPAFYLARTLRAEKNRAAPEQWRHALDLAKDVGGMDLLRGEALEALENYAAASSAYEAAIHAAPGDYHGYDRLDALLVAAGNAADRETTWRRITSELPDAARAWFLLAIACGAGEKWAEVVDSGRKAHALAPQDPAIAALLGHACVAVGDYAGAVAPLRAALTLNPDIVIAKEDLARALAATGGK